MNTKDEEEYIALKGRLERQLDNYGLRNKSKSNKPTDIKLKVANSSKLFLVKQRQPVCKSTNLVLQICQEASIGDPDLFRELILNKDAIKLSNTTVAKKSRHAASHYRIPANPGYTENDGRSLNVKTPGTLKSGIRQPVPHPLTARVRPRTPFVQRTMNWQPPSKAIGIQAPRPILSKTHQLGLRKVPIKSRKHQAMRELNRRMMDMWKHWKAKMDKDRRHKENIRVVVLQDTI